MQELMISGVDEESGYCFATNHPRIWWTFEHNGVRYLRYDFLTWGEEEQAFQAKPSLDGRSLRIYAAIPRRFMDMIRVLHQYQHMPLYAAAIAAGDSGQRITDAMFQQGVAAMQKISDTFDMARDIKPMTEITLPFQVLQNPLDPYDEDGPGTVLHSYPISQGDPRRFFVYSVYLRAAEVARTPSQARYEQHDF